MRTPNPSPVTQTPEHTHVYLECPPCTCRLISTTCNPPTWMVPSINATPYNIPPDPSPTHPNRATQNSGVPAREPTKGKKQRKDDSRRHHHPPRRTPPDSRDTSPHVGNKQKTKGKKKKKSSARLLPAATNTPINMSSCIFSPPHSHFSAQISSVALAHPLPSSLLSSP
ncbi:hypothetical protein K505DRAFT_323085 [Melanomma pulvis-pyrius CBS 109.77]|uniref:Uncharacterized protein n=1 Tax=Melanomma pulvis-pyrius CBS 109.77 TaxID=1314802 RepID=A0A6A6XMH8_9PLEO|nr:hypothetical protein K505DRAFT_323085 [Melanomma pulvis-pyrius CBS 109.77]